jgi:hypothetical protein
LKTNHEIDSLLTLTFDWAKKHEAIILSNGIELTADQEIDAFLTGVKEAKKIRLLKSDPIPLPHSPILKAKLEELGLLNSNTFGLTLGYGIYIKSDHWNKREILVHEFAHVMQYEKFGFKEFLFHYISECLSPGYPFGSLEAEARKIEKEICSSH